MSAVVEANECPNCGASVSTPYCPMCGQENVPHRLSVGAILKDALEDFIRWDSKLLHTLDPLFRRPGFLTQEWSRGRLNRYISPVKLYVTATFLFFLVAAYRTGPGRIAAPTHRATPGVTDAELAHRAGLYRFPEVEKFIDRQFFKLGGRGAKNEVMIQRMPQALFILLPLFALALRTFYRRPRRHYVEHLVFGLHTHAFTFLVLTIAALLGGPAWTLLALVASGGYTLIALRQVYGQKWIPTLVKGTILGTGYLVLLVLAAFITLLLTALALPDAPIR